MFRKLMKTNTFRDLKMTYRISKRIYNRISRGIRYNTTSTQREEFAENFKTFTFVVVGGMVAVHHRPDTGMFSKCSTISLFMVGASLGQLFAVTLPYNKHFIAVVVPYYIYTRLVEDKHD